MLMHVCRFSTDEGQCWHTYNFTNDPLHFSGMDSEPGARSMNVSLWGYRNDFSKWVVVTIDFKKLLTRDCECTRKESRFRWLDRVLIRSVLQVMMGTTWSGLLILQTEADPVMAACWGIRRRSCV